MPDTITPQNQFEEDIEFIRTTDRVLGDPPGTQGVLSGPINIIIQKIANSLLYLKNRLDNLTFTPPNATTTVKGIAEIATKQEAETGTDTTRITPPKRVFDILKHSNAQATTTQRGTSERATQAEADTGTNDTNHLTPKKVKDAYFPTSTATVSVSNSKNVTVRENIRIGSLLILRVEFDNDIGTNDTWTLGGGAWRILSTLIYDNSENTYEIIGSTNNQLQAIVHNTNNTQFRLTNNLNTNDEILVLALKV